jgi:hypothetical protein
MIKWPLSTSQLKHKPVNDDTGLLPLPIQSSPRESALGHESDDFDPAVHLGVATKEDEDGDSFDNADTLSDLVLSPGQLLPPIILQAAKTKKAVRAHLLPTAQTLYQSRTLPTSIRFAWGNGPSSASSGTSAAGGTPLIYGGRTLCLCRYAVIESERIQSWAACAGPAAGSVSICAVPHCLNPRPVGRAWRAPVRHRVLATTNRQALQHH